MNDTELDTLRRQFLGSVARTVQGRVQMPAPTADLHLAVDAIQKVNGDLSALGVSWRSSLARKIDPKVSCTHDTSDPWQGLLLLLSAHDDASLALPAWEAMAHHIRGYETKAGFGLVTSALPHPTWRNEAIQRHPRVFRDAVGFDPWDTAILVLAGQRVRQYNDTYDQTNITLKLLLQAGVPVMPCGRTGITPLGKAILSRSEDSARAFVEAVPQLLNIPDSKGTSPWHYAIGKEYVSLLDCFSEHGVQWEQRDHAGFTFLRRAVTLNAVNSIRWFFDAGMVDKAALSDALEHARDPQVQALLYALQAEHTIADVQAPDSQHHPAPL